jgi:aerobic-type carbon monoxide dehydrogenase small subunit (CoxS/CutS family)
MKVKKESKKRLSPAPKEKANSRTSVKTGGAISDIANTKFSRRTLLRGTATAAAVVGVSSVAMQKMKFDPLREQSSTSSSTSTSTIQTNTATLPPPAPIVATSPTAQRTITLTVNGTNYSVNVEPRSMLVDVLREDLNLIATKRACNRMSCGTCTVLIDGVPREACNVMAIRAVGHTIMTAEIATGDPVVNAIQQAWVTQDGGQCGFCSPGFIMAAAGLLKANPNPSLAQIKEALSGNLCRCGNYVQIIAAVQTAATALGGA